MVSGSLIAAAVSIGSSILDNLGVTLQKSAHKHVHQGEFYCLNLRWLIGLGLYLAAQLFNGMALSLAPQAVFASLAGIGIIVNSVFSTYVHKEKLSWTSIAGMSVIITGTILIVIFGPSSSHDTSWRDLRRFSSNAIFLSYIGLLLLFMGTWLTAIFYCEKQVGFRSSTPIEVEALLDELPVNIPELPETIDKEALPYRFLGVAYAIFGGMMGSLTQLLAKCFLQLLKSSMHGDQQFHEPAPYITLFLVLLLGGSQIHFLNVGLRRFDQLLIVPVFIISITIFSSTIGLIFFQEYNSFTSLQITFFTLSLCFTTIGVVITAYGQLDIQKDHEYDALVHRDGLERQE